MREGGGVNQIHRHKQKPIFFERPALQSYLAPPMNGSMQW
jgi:hypothetical protein